MKKVLFSLVPVMLALCVCSCVSTKKIVYFQGADSLYTQAQQILQQYEMKLKPADQVLIKVTCSDPELLLVFAQDVTMGTLSNYSSANITTGNSVANAYGYTVTNEGDLNLPAVGAVPVVGLTVEEAATRIEERIKEKGLIKDPDVTVRFLNARVAVLGAVATPGVVNLTSERNTILDVLAMCHDVDDTGLRRRVKLFREENGERKMYEIDLTKADVFTNPAYYVQQNDMIYVEPNKSKSVKSSAFYTFWTAGASIISLLATIISTVVVIKKW